MKTRPIYLGLAALSIIFLALPSCQKDSTVTSGSGVSIQANNKTFSIPVGNNISPKPAPPMVTWDIAWMNVSRITLSYMAATTSVRDSSQQKQLLWQGPAKIDLFNMNNLIGNMGLAPGQYGTLTYSVWALESDAGNSSVFYLSGLYNGTSNNKPVPIVLDIRDDLIFSGTRHNVTISPEKGFTGRINLYLDRLFAGILPADLENTTQNDGRILISPTSNPELYQEILKNLRIALNPKDGKNETAQDKIEQ